MLVCCVAQGAAVAAPSAGVVTGTPCVYVSFTGSVLTMDGITGEGGHTWGTKLPQQLLPQIILQPILALLQLPYQSSQQLQL